MNEVRPDPTRAAPALGRRSAVTGALPVALLAAVLALALATSSASAQATCVRRGPNGTLLRTGHCAFLPQVLRDASPRPVGIPGAWIDVSVGGDSERPLTCGLRRGGFVECFSLVERRPVPRVPSGEYRQISVGGELACALGRSGSAACWHLGARGEGEMEIPVPGEDMMLVRAGHNHACALHVGGAISCWDLLGDPFDAPSGSGFSGLVSGTTFSCAIRSDGGVECWGLYVPTPPAGAFRTIAAGTSRACGIRYDGTLACWKLAVIGDLPPPPGTFTHISMGVDDACGLRSDGALLCWNELWIAEVHAPGSRIERLSHGGRSDGWKSSTCAILSGGELV